VRDNERAAASLGVGVVEAKLYAFALSSALAAAAGVLVAFRNPRLSFAQFNLFGNVNAVLYATLGGIGWVGGAAVAGLAQAEGGLAHVLRHVVEVRDWYLVGASIALLVTVISRPDGVFPDLVDRRTAIGRRRRPTAVSAPLSPRPSAGVRRVPPKALQLEDLQVRFGGVVALDGVSLAVAPGEVVGLIGPNGAGKTTLIDAASGFVAYRGSVRLGDTRLDGCSPRARAKAGLTRSFQSLELFEDLSVGDNLAVAADDGRRWVYAADLLRPSRTRMTAAAVAAIEDFGLSPVLDLRPAELPYAQRRMVAIARAVASSPSVLLLDEPAAGLDDWATAELTELVRRLARDWGMGVLLVEHDVGMVMDVCDRVVVLDFGRVIAVGSPAEVRGNRAVVTAYLGDVAGGGPDVADADVGQRAGFRARPQ
jgi:sulfate-transporting ATPase